MADSKKFKPQYKDTDGTLKDLILDSSAISGLFSGSYNDLTDKPTIPDISNMVTTDTTQTVSGGKTFSAPVTLTSTELSALSISPAGAGTDIGSTYLWLGSTGVTLKKKLKDSTSYVKLEANTGAPSGYGIKVNPGGNTAYCMGFQNADGTIALTKDIPDVTGMLTTSNYATTLGNVYQAKGDYVSAEAGKGLSTNDYDATDKTFVGKLEQIIPTLEPTSGDQIEILHQHGGYMKIGSYSPKAEDDNHCWLDITSDGDGWSLEAQPMGETNRFRVMVTTNGTHSMTEDINYEFKQDGLYLNNSKVTFSGSYNDLTNKPTASDIGAAAASHNHESLKANSSNSFVIYYGDADEELVRFSDSTAGFWLDMDGDSLFCYNKENIDFNYPIKISESIVFSDGSTMNSAPDVSSKLDKITNQTAAAIVYAASKSGDTVTQTSYQLTSNATGSTAMFRDGNGRTKVATPVNDTEAANKGYVDGKVGSYKITSYTVDKTAGTINLTIEDI